MGFSVGNVLPGGKIRIKRLYGSGPFQQRALKSLSLFPDAADDEIARIARKGDIVFTNDGGLTKRCIAAGATVVDREGARFSPADFLGGVSLQVLRQQRYDDLERESPVLSADLRVIDAAEAALALWM